MQVIMLSLEVDNLPGTSSHAHKFIIKLYLTEVSKPVVTENGDI